MGTPVPKEGVVPGCCYHFRSLKRPCKAEPQTSKECAVQAAAVLLKGQEQSVTAMLKEAGDRNEQSAFAGSTLMGSIMQMEGRMFPYPAF